MITPEDVFIMARTVYGEGRGESYHAKKAIAHVIINRTRKKIGDRDHSLAATCLRYWQFSAWLEEDPNRQKMIDANINNRLFRECLRACLEALDEDDFTKGSDHYHAAYMMPYWAEGKHPALRLDGHLFYNNVR